MPKETEMKATEMKTADIRKYIVDLFVNIIDSVTNEQLKHSTKNLLNKGFPDLTNMSREEHIQLVKDGVDDLGRVSLIAMSNGLHKKLTEFIKGMS